MAAALRCSSESTTEHVALWIWDRLADLPLKSIRVWETATGSVVYHGPRES